MPRSNNSFSSNRSTSFSSSRLSQPSTYSYSSPKTPITVPTTTSTPSVQQHNVQIEKPGFFSNMWTGFGLGAGQSIAMNIFRSDPKVNHIHENISVGTTKSTLEENLPKEFVQCMKDNDNDKDLCKQFLE
jgi:hypothetical protein